MLSEYFIVLYPAFFILLPFSQLHGYSILDKVLITKSRYSDF